MVHRKVHISQHVRILKPRLSDQFDARAEQNIQTLAIMRSNEMLTHIIITDGLFNYNGTEYNT